MQHVPWFNFIYGGVTGNDCELPAAAQHLREWPLDLVGYSYHNSHRADLAPRPGYVPCMGGTRAISPREQNAEWGSSSALDYDGGQGGRGITPPIGWLEDYWRGRYHGFIEAPKTDLPPWTPPPSLVSVAKAAPYNGPARPAAAWEKKSPALRGQAWFCRLRD